MASGEIHKHDIGTVLKFTVKDENGDAVNLASASTKNVMLKKPNGKVLTKSSSFYTDGTDGILTYTIVDGDLDLNGTWENQVYVVINSNEFYSDIHEMVVYRNLL